MQATARRPSTESTSQGVVYRTICQNPGCGFQFDLRITPQNAALLGGTMACPRCHRRGGMLKREGRLGEKLFGAKLIFLKTGIGSGSADEEDRYQDGLVS